VPPLQPPVAGVFSNSLLTFSAGDNFGPIRHGPGASMTRRELILRSPMTAEEVQLVRALAKFGLKAGSADKRFCRDLAAITRRQQKLGLTEGQRGYLWRIADRYRLQLPPELFSILQARRAGSSHPSPQSSGHVAAVELTGAAPPIALDIGAESYCT
jgi:hypothetical protein